MRYDASSDALFHPERQLPIVRTAPWPLDALCAELSRLAYIRFDESETEAGRLRQAVTGLGFAEPRLFRDDRPAPGTFALAAEGFCAIDADRHAVIAFRGTQPDSFKDFMSDARFLPTAWRGRGSVHRGFAETLDAVLPQIEAWLTEMRPARLTITGHSLGAALATLMAALRPEAELVTFGSPRVGNGEFAAAFAGRSMRRYVDCGDIVTLVPPAIYFVHLDGFRYIDRHGQVHARDPGNLAIARDRAAAALEYPWLAQSGKVPLRALADHAPINYVSAVLDVREEG